MGMPAPAPSILTFADLLRRHRVAAGLTQEELAARAHLSVDAVSTLERGTRRAPRKDTVALLAEALALAPDDTATFAATARRAPAAALAATPAADAALTGRNAEGPASHAALPSGVVTFLFADIEGSTTLLRQLGDRFADVLAALQAVLRPVWAAHAGCELGLQDDHVFVVFARADDALAAAGAAQRVLATQTWPAGARVRLRMGVHSGQALLTAGRYVGLEVHRAGRIAAAGHGGQVVVSQAWVDQNAKYGHALPDGTRLRDLGMHRLRDLGRRERLYQLTLPDLPAAFPPLRTLDAWPGLRADLSVVALLSVVLLAVVGLLLSLIEPSFPRAIGLGAASLAGLLLATSAVARPARRALVAQWRDARKPFSAVTSVLLSLVIVVTTLFITKPTTFLVPPHLGYDFTYTYHVPTKTGGTVTIGLWYPLQTLAPIDLSGLPSEQYFGLWNGCVVQLPDLTLGQLGGWKADQCTEVPTVANHEESPSGTTTTFHIDPRAVWSDGVPVTADDYLFTFKMLADPDIVGGAPLNNMKLTAVDHQTVRIDWSVPYGDYLNVLASLRPIPLHVYTTGAFAGVYDPATGAYNSTLAKNLLASDVFNVSIRVDSGPFTVQSYVPGRQAVLVRNPHFYSNFFHPPALDRVTFVTENRPAPGPPPKDAKAHLIDSLLGMYRSRAVDLVEGLSPLNLSQVRNVPKAQVITSPGGGYLEIGFNQRGVAPNAQANQGVSIFRDIAVRRAFVEAFDRCAAIRAQLAVSNCTDPNLHTDELTTPPAPDYDSSVKLPGYNPADAARLLNQAGYPVVAGTRRYKDGKTPIQLTIYLSFTGIENSGIARNMQQDYSRNLQVAVSLVPMPNITVPGFPDPRVEGRFDILLEAQSTPADPVGAALGNLGGADTADIPSAQNPTGPNWLGVIDPQVAKQDALGSITIDGAQRDIVYRELQRYVTLQFYFEPVYAMADVTLTRPSLCNFKKWPAAGLNTWNMADWYVAPSCP